MLNLVLTVPDSEQLGPDFPLAWFVMLRVVRWIPQPCSTPRNRDLRARLPVDLPTENDPRYSILYSPWSAVATDRLLSQDRYLYWLTTRRLST